MTINEVTIFQFQQIHSARVHHEDNPFEVGCELINIFDGIPTSETKKLKVKEFEKRIEKYNFLNDFTPPDKWVTEFDLNGKTYKVEQFIHNWNVGQWISMNTLLKNYTPNVVNNERDMIKEVWGMGDYELKSQNELISNLHLIIATLCEDERSLIERANEFQKDLPIVTAYPIALFFCAVLAKFQKDFPNYFQTTGNKTGSIQSGGGMIRASIYHLLKMLKLFIKKRFSIS
jgi:hypothetical protein